MVKHPIVQRRKRLIFGVLLGNQEISRLGKVTPGHRGDSATPRQNGAVGQRPVEVRDHKFRVEFGTLSQTIAGRAGSVGTVETECAWFEFLIADATFWAAVARTKQLVAPSRRRAWWILGFVADDHQTVALLGRQLDRFANS